MQRLFTLLFGSLVILALPGSLWAQLPCKPVFQSSGNHTEHFALHTLQNLFSGRGAGGYTSYAESSFTTTLAIGRRYPVTITYPYLAGTSGPFAIWIDFDGDSVFSAAERVYIDTVKKHQTFGFISIPNNSAFVGKKLMRVLSAFYSQSVTACGTYSAGEAEDYVITIAANVPDTPSYCLPVVERPNESFGIDTFRLHQLDNSGSGGSPTGYSYIPPSVHTTPLVIGQRYPVYISHAAQFYSGDFSIWIDLDADGEFSQAERLMYSAANDGWMFTSTLRIPAAQVDTGLRRMRVRAGSGYGVGSGPCGLRLFGETEDYDVRIVAPLRVDDPGNDLAARIYPNLVSDAFRLDCPVPLAGPISLSVVNGLGQCVLQLGNLQTGQSNIDVSALPGGVYFATIRAGNRVRRLRFLKL